MASAHPLISHLTPAAAKQLRGDGDTVWRDWGTGVRQRTKAFSDGIEHSLFWGVSDSDGQQLEALIAASRSEFVLGVERTVADSFSVAGALSIIDAAWQLPQSAGRLVWSEWESIFGSLNRVLDDAAELAPDRAPLIHQILCGELQLTLACLLPDFAAGRDWIGVAESAFGEGFEAILDGGGMPQSHDLPVLRQLLACWTRSRSLAAKCGCKVFDRRVREQYRWVIEQVLRLTRRDGTAVFSLPTENSSDEVASTVAMIEAAVELSRDDDNIDVALLVLPKRSSLAGRRRDGVRAERLPDSSYLSEWSCVSVMRSGWDFCEVSVAVATPAIYEEVAPPLVAPRGRWSDEQFQIELNLRGATLLSGAWRVGVTASASGKPLAVTTHWTETGSVSEPEYDYLEWELTFEGGVRIERQIVLAHNSEILLIADTLIPAAGKKSGAVPLVYTSSLPVACFGGATIQSDDRDATEVVLASPNATVQSRLFPLFLPEWRKSPSAGKFFVARLAERDKSLEIEWQTTESGPRGTAFLPVIIDLDKSRLKRPYTWRHLTVGENLRAVSRDEASGYRLACGDDQFLLYRSHTEQRNRTVLGHNLVSELLLAKFSAADGVEVITEIGRDE